MASVPTTKTDGASVFTEVNMGSSDSSQTVRATVVQASTIFYDTPSTLDKAERLVAEAASHGSQLAVFPEAFLGGYPRGSNFGVTIGSRTLKGKEDYLKYQAAAITVPGPEVDRLAAMAGKYKVFLVMGAVERDGYTLYCSVLFFDNQGCYLGKHRKIMPTGIEIYCAPTGESRDFWQASMRHIALEGGCFVLSANQFCRRKDFPPSPEYEFTGTDEELTPESVVSAGGSVIVSPSGAVLAGPNYDGEALITADLDLGDIARAKFDFDVVGHYARPEVLSLIVRDEPATPVSFTSDGSCK